MMQRRGLLRRVDGSLRETQHLNGVTMSKTVSIIAIAVFLSGCAAPAAVQVRYDASSGNATYSTGSLHASPSRGVRHTLRTAVGLQSVCRQDGLDGVD